MAASEILKSDIRTREYIEKGNSEGKSLIDAMEQGEQDGIQTLDGEIEKMVRDGVLTQDGALPYSINASNLLLRLGDLSEQPAIPKATVVLREEDSMIDIIER